MARISNDNPSALNVHLGRRLIELRTAERITQKDLAALGVTFQQVQKYERGVNRISAASLLRAAEALDMGVGTFLEGYSVMTPEDDINDAVV